MFMKNLVKLGAPLTGPEFHNLFMAYKNHVGSLRNSWQTMTSIIKREKDPHKKELNKSTLNAIEKELKGYCAEILVS